VIDGMAVGRMGKSRWEIKEKHTRVNTKRKKYTTLCV